MSQFSNVPTGRPNRDRNLHLAHWGIGSLVPMSHLLSRDRILLSAIIAIGIFFRFYRLDQLPPGFQFDQAFYVFDSLRLLQGEPHIFFAAPGGTEPLFPYLAMVGVALFGVTSLGLKLTSAVIGVLTIPLVYGFGRTLFRSDRIGLLAAFFTAISVWHIYYGRYGERITLLVLLVLPMFLFFWRALDRRASRDFVLTGVFLALGLYTNLAARVLPFALILMIAYMALSDRRHASDYIRGLVILGVVAAVLFLPLGVYFVFHPDQFISHTAQVSIFVPHARESGDIPAALWQNTLRLLGMFSIRGDDGIIRNVPQRPVFDPLTTILFIVGVLVWLATLVRGGSPNVERRRAMLLLVWIAGGMSISLVTDDAPNFSRLQPIIPAVMILPAWGASALWDRLSRATHETHGSLARLPVAAPALAIGLFSIVGLAAAVSSFYDYFIVLQNDPGLYYAFDTDKVEISNWVNDNAARDQLFLAPVTYQVGTVSLLTRTSLLKSFESRDTIVLPAKEGGKDAVFGFPFEQDRKAQTMLSRLGALAMRQDLKGSNGTYLLENVRVPVESLPDAADPLEALARGGEFLQAKTPIGVSWGNAIDVLGATLSPEGPGERNLAVTLFLQGISAMSTDYTFSIKVRDTQGRVWGQEDKWAGDNSYATSQWGVGDVIVEKFYPGLSACAPAGNFQVSVEAYDPKTLDVLARADGQGNAISLGSFAAGASQGNRLEDLEIEHALDVGVGGQLRLIGYNLSPETLKPGEAFSLALFWKGTGKGSSADVTVRLGSVPLIERSVNLPEDGRGLCSFFDLTAPANVASGTMPLSVNNVRIADVPASR